MPLKDRLWASQLALVVKNLPANSGDMRCGFNPWTGRALGEGNGNPFQYSCLEKSHVQKSLVSYSPQGYKQLGMTEAT